MKLNINLKKVISLLIAGGITLNATMLDAKAPTTEDTITTIIVDNLNEMHKRNIVKDDDIDIYYNRDANSVAYANCSNQILPPQKQMIVDKNIYEEIYDFIGTPNYDKLTHAYKPIYEVRDTPLYNELDNTYSINTEVFISGYEDVYFDSTVEEHFKEKYDYSKIKQR